MKKMTRRTIFENKELFNELANKTMFPQWVYKLVLFIREIDELYFEIYEEYWEYMKVDDDKAEIYLDTPVNLVNNYTMNDLLNYSMDISVAEFELYKTILEN